MLEAYHEQEQVREEKSPIRSITRTAGLASVSSYSQQLSHSKTSANQLNKVQKSHPEKSPFIRDGTYGLNHKLMS